MRTNVQTLADRFANVGDGQRQGHMFELMHELSFNLNAIAKDDAARLRVTTWLGQPHAPDDLRLLDGHGDVIGGVQAKVVTSVAGRLGPKNGLSDPKYDGMTLLTPSEHAAEADNLLNRRLAMPEGPYHQRYRDVQDRLSDQVTHGPTQSAPVSLGELKSASDDPVGYLKGLLHTNELRQVATAGVTAGVLGALIAGAVTVTHERIRSGSFDDVDWAEAGIEAAKGGLKAAAIAMAGQGISIAAQHAAAAGGGAVAHALGGGSLPFALARGAFDLGAIGHGLATHKLTSRDAAYGAAESITQTGAVWACSAIGQSIIPLPVVGAVVGGMVGQYGSHMLIQALRLATAARDTDPRWDAEYEALLLQTEQIRLQAETDLAELHDLAERYDTAFSGLVLPRLDRLAVAVGSATPNEVLDDLAELTRLYGGTPLFTSMEDFDAFMADDDIPLRLDLGSPTFTHHERPQAPSRTITPS